MNAAPTPRVSSSPRNSAPAATATAGLTYVITVERVGPTSLISSRKATKATAVQITPRPARANRTVGEGTVEGQVIEAGVAYTSAASPRQDAVSCKDGTSRRCRAAIRGAVA
ncbi:hypothetical protein OG864_35830 [Streptomyces sp. NBC_00124]|nr:hypothetical protein [Streptomyces sp. NBC_00124]MCX5364056.1 hypothetical protein [Streptomyces sp. NBC_00124]